MIYRWDDLCESQDFEHDQKFVKAEHWREACDELEDKVKTIAFKDQEITRLKKALEIANEAIGFYVDEWEMGKTTTKDTIKESDIEWVDHTPPLRACHHIGGKRAREAQKQIKEIMEGK